MPQSQFYHKRLALRATKHKIKSVLEYAAPIWSGLPQYLAGEIENIQNRSMNILGVPRDN